jgi:hypothetical protein
LEATVAMWRPRIIARYASAYPEILTLRTGTSAQSAPHVLQRERDGAFVAGPTDHVELARAGKRAERGTGGGYRPPIEGLQQIDRAGDLNIAVLRVGNGWRQR